MDYETNVQIETINDVLIEVARSDFAHLLTANSEVARSDFADLLEKFEKLRSERREQADLLEKFETQRSAQLELDLQKTRDDALAFFDSVPYLREWISTRFQANIDFNQVFNNYVDEKVDLDQMISDRVDFEDLVINNVD